ncbi:MAG: siderophore-interacting protein [Acidimicrobiia bacterium]|nr:siderophore-interacting protein [Acidimicrobiia bacterium]
MISLEVLRTEQLSPHMVRVVAGGAAFDDFTDNGLADHYVKLVIPRPGVDYPTPFTMENVQASLPREQWPAIRTYTVRRYDPGAREIWIDVVHHGDEGLAGPWAANAQPGDLMRLRGPGGAYTPLDQADWHLLAGDESALPAIASALEAMPHGTDVMALIEVAGPADELPLHSPANVDVRWLHRSGGDPSFSAALHALEMRAGVVQAFVHGELGQIRDIKAHLLHERGIAPELLSISGYWRQGKDEDDFQAAKRTGG